jgi:ABC-2 type transport system permease protein
MNGFFILMRRSIRALLNVRRVLREQSLFKVVFTLLFAGGLLAGLWALFYEGFTFLDTLGGVGLVLIHRLFSVFFFGLAMLLVLSSVITAYTSFFRSRELPYLVIQPIEMSDLVFYKYVEATIYSSWAFFFIIIPFVGAYAQHEQLSWFFSLWTLIFSIPFVLLCSAVGTLLGLIIMRWLPGGRTLVVLALLALGWIGWYAWKTFAVGLSPGDDTTLILSRLVPGMRLAAYPLWPSWWVAEGIMSLSRGQTTRGLMFLGVLLANLAFLLLVLEAAGRRLFYEGWQRVLHRVSAHKRRAVLLPRLERAMRILPGDVRAMMLKDIRVFLRDPAQWSQGVFFFGLLAIYFLNLRNLHYHNLPVQWRNLIAFLNVFSVSAVLSSLGCRFVYPQLSLEGHGFWILGLSPSSMGRILLAKFALAATGMVVVSYALMLICVHMLRVEAYARGVSLSIAVAVALAVAGLSTGLGAIYRDMRQRNPAAILSGFGGTLNLVLNLAFIVVAMFPFAFVFHLRRIGFAGPDGLQKGLLFAFAWLAIATALATMIPLVLGRRSLERGEY